MTVMVRTGAIGPDQKREVAPGLDFVEAPLGMTGLRSWTLHPLDEWGFLFAMRSTEADDVRLFVVAPEPYFPGYAPRIDATALDALGIEGEPVLLTVVHPGDGQHPPTANLLAPVVVNPATGSAMQVVLDSDEWPLRAPFTAAV
jgi:flagellar assembly factor FliW